MPERRFLLLVGVVNARAGNFVCPYLVFALDCGKNGGTYFWITNGFWTEYLTHLEILNANLYFVQRN